MLLLFYSIKKSRHHSAGIAAGRGHGVRCWARFWGFGQIIFDSTRINFIFWFCLNGCIIHHLWCRFMIMMPEFLFHRIQYMYAMYWMGPHSFGIFCVFIFTKFAFDAGSFLVFFQGLDLVHSKEVVLYDLFHYLDALTIRWQSK